MPFGLSGNASNMSVLPPNYTLCLRRAVSIDGGESRIGASSLSVWITCHKAGEVVPLHTHEVEEVLTFIAGEAIMTVGKDTVAAHADGPSVTRTAWASCIDAVQHSIVRVRRRIADPGRGMRAYSAINDSP